MASCTVPLPPTPPVVPSTSSASSSLSSGSERSIPEREKREDTLFHPPGTHIPVWRITRTQEQNLSLSLELGISSSLTHQQVPPGSTCLCYHGAGIAENCIKVPLS